MNHLHIYGQRFHHGEAYIVGDAFALCALRDAIDEALANRSGKADAFVNDGEGFETHVLRLDADRLKWVDLAVPYSEDYAREHRENAEWPERLLMKELSRP